MVVSTCDGTKPHIVHRCARALGLKNEELNYIMVHPLVRIYDW